jgi:RHS repeat-associated protein
MVASSIPNNTVPTSTRAQTRAGGWIASSDNDVADTPTSTLCTIASIHETPADSSMTTSTLTGPFCCNHQYSVTAITTSTGAIAERYAYTAYGQPTILNASGLPLTPQSSTLSNRYTYTGREWDATLGLHHFRARWISPSAGRFLGRDPIGYEDGKSLYRLRIGLSLMDSTGRYIHDAFGKWCCEGDASTSCCVTIKVRRPCRTVAVQIADNLLHGFAPDHGVNSGHAWIDGFCNNSWFRVGLWQDPNNPGQGIVNNEGPLEQQFGFSHKKSFCGLCHASFECMYSSLFAADNNPPPYCLIDPTENGCANCASFVTDHLKGCGMRIPHASDPWQLTSGAEQVGPCYPDGAGKP